ncbi:MAG: hypothetical protein GY863_17130 [bacterium]|nr:hypothetical protein [bacterium]
MKKFITAVIIIFCSYNSLQAQSGFGIRAGIVFSAFQNNKLDYIYRHDVGVFRDFILTENTLFSIGINHMEKGGVIRDISVTSRMNVGSTYPEGYLLDIYVRTRYLEFPFLIKYISELNDTISLHPYLGLSYSKSLPLDEERADNSIIKNRRDIIKDNYDDFDAYIGMERPPRNNIFSLISGCMLSSRSNFLDLKFFYGFTELGATLEIEPIPYKNYGFSISLGCYFR